VRWKGRKDEAGRMILSARIYRRNSAALMKTDTGENSERAKEGITC
jgi:hypothetical protein